MEQGMGARSRATEIKCSAGCGRTVATLPAGQELARAGALGASQREVRCACGATTIVRSAPARAGVRDV